MSNEIVNWIKNEVKKAKAKGVIVAVSGGIDSAVVAALAIKAFPKNSLGLWMDIDSSQESSRNALRIFSKYNMKNIRINIKNDFDNLFKTIFEVPDLYKDVKTYENYIKTGIMPEADKSYLEDPNIDLIKGNLKARIRMSILYSYEQKNNFLVLSTSNLCEDEIGYYTKWGDGVGDIAPIIHLLKSDVYKLAKELDVPLNVINSKPTADLWEGQTDEEEMGFTYDELEKYIKGEKISSSSKNKIELLKLKNNHKKKNIPSMR